MFVCDSEKKRRSAVAKDLYKRIAGKRNAGTTMVELIVSFALLAIFLSAVTMVISNSLLTYYREQKQMSIYSVADAVLSEIRNDIRTMQPSAYVKADGTTVSANGFVKLRNSGTPDGDSVYRGSTIEFMKSNENDGAILEQIDTAGCGPSTALIKSDEVIKKAIGDTIPADQLTARFYMRISESKDKYKGFFGDTHRSYFCDIKASDSSMATDSVYGSLNNYSSPASVGGAGGTYENNGTVVWGAENRLPDKLYQGFLVKTEFEIKPETDAAGNEVVTSVVVKVRLYENSVEEENFIYEKEGVVPLQNIVYYKTDKTLYSDVY